MQPIRLRAITNSPPHMLPIISATNGDRWRGRCRGSLLCTSISGTRRTDGRWECEATIDPAPQPFRIMEIDGQIRTFQLHAIKRFQNFFAGWKRVADTPPATPA